MCEMFKQRVFRRGCVARTDTAVDIGLNGRDIVKAVWTNRMRMKHGLFATIRARIERSDKFQ